MTGRLARSTWISHGLAELNRKGVSALTANAMASSLGVSRGSFYWHFRDIADFRAALLEQWRVWATGRVIQELDARGEPGERITRLMIAAFAERPRDETNVASLDRAVRTWALDDPVVAQAVTRVDAERTTYIADMLERSGLPAKTAVARARFVYLAYLGLAHDAHSDRRRLTPAAIAGIAALFLAPDEVSSMR